MKELVIDRSVWQRGFVYGGTSSLVHEDGHMCCLGIYLHACGVPKKRLRGVSSPSNIRNALLPKQAQWLLGARSVKAGGGLHESVFMDVNDRTHPAYSAERAARERGRESELRALFRAHGVSVRFVGRTSSLLVRKGQTERSA